MFRVCLLIFCLAQPLAADDLSGKARAIDGDGLDLGFSQKIRLYGIDAPERDQFCGADLACGQEATKALANLIDGKIIRCQPIGAPDRYGRIIAKCFEGGTDIGRRLVQLGYARAYLRYSQDYAEDEKQAIFAKRGLWAADFGSPAEHRRDKPRASKTPDGCLLKGNIARNGSKIFHAPGQRDYAKVSIDTGKGERCFETSAQAKAAGWRAAKR